MRLPSSIGFAAAKPFQTVVIGAVIGAVLGSAIAITAPTRVKASLAFTVVQQARQETADYSYDGYYAIRAAELVSDSMISWLSTPSVVKEIYALAGLDVSEAEALAAAGRAFRGKKYSSQNVVVSFTAQDEDAARKLAAAASDLLTDRATGLVLSARGDSLFHVTAASPVIARISTSSASAAIAGAFVGMFAAFALAYIARASADQKP